MSNGMQTGEKTLILIRHAPTAGNQSRRYVGMRTDESSSDSGRDLLAEQADRLRKITNGAVWFTGPMKRCRETAEVISHGGTPIVIEAFREIDFGDFEGKTYEELSSDPAYQAWIDSGGEIPFPGGERKEDYVNLQMQGLNTLLYDLGNRQKAVLICHGGTIMAIMSTLTGGAYFDYHVSHLDGYILRFSKEDERISDLSYDRIGDRISG